MYAVNNHLAKIYAGTQKVIKPGANHLLNGHTGCYALGIPVKHPIDIGIAQDYKYLG